MNSRIGLCLFIYVLSMGQLLPSKINHLDNIVTEQNSCVCAGMFVVSSQDTFSQRSSCTSICKKSGFEAGLSSQAEKDLFQKYLSQRKRAKSCEGLASEQVQVLIPQCEGFHSPSYGKRCALLYKSVCEQLSFKESHQVKNNI